MESSLSDAPERTSDAASRPLDRSARAAVTALARSLEVFDPPAARRAALRAHLVDRIAVAAAVPISERVDAITASILAEIGILLTHVRPVGTADLVPDPASAVLSATVLDKLPGLSGTARAVRHQFERYDGSGGPQGLRGPDIPMAARLLALAATLVGHPHADAAPNWTGRRHRVAELLGTALDPSLGTAAAAELEAGDPMPKDLTIDDVLSGLERFIPLERDSPVEALISIGAAVRAADRMPDLLMLIGEQARRTLRASSVAIGRLDAADHTFETLVNAGATVGQERFPVSEFHGSDDLPGLDQLFTGEGFVRSTADGRADDSGMISLHRRGLRSEAAWPIIIGDAVWGVVWATTRGDAASLDHDDLATLRLVATHVAAAVTQSERIAEFEELALRDPLTQLGNRRVLEQKLNEIFRRPPVDRQDVALIMCDVDGLKLVNDTSGHAAGDELLIEAARALREAAETVDDSTTCRIGGDEFCIILDGGGMLSAQAVAELAVRLFAASGPNRSLSAGIAYATTNMHSPGQLLREADEAQYEDKRRRKELPTLSQLSDGGDRRLNRRAP